MRWLGQLTLLLALLLTRCGPAEENRVKSILIHSVRIESLREWKYIVLHHTASEAGSVESIDADHRTRKDAQGNPWRGIGYHFLIGNGHGMQDGEVAATFRWKKQCEGAHAGDSVYNNQGIGICLVGNFQEAPPTPAQWQSLQLLIRTLRRECRIDHAGIVRHTDIKATACPGKQFPWDQLLRVEQAREVQSLGTLRKNPHHIHQE